MVSMDGIMISKKIFGAFLQQDKIYIELHEEVIYEGTGIKRSAS